MMRTILPETPPPDLMADVVIPLLIGMAMGGMVLLWAAGVMWIWKHH